MALSAFQGDLMPAKKTEENPFFGMKYASLASVWDAVRKPLAENGLSVTQTLGNDLVKNDILIVETTLLHKSGEWLASKLAITLTKQDPQAIGSAISYARRYSLSAILGVAAEDDDAESATDHKEEKKEPAHLLPDTGKVKAHWCTEHNVAFFKTENMRSFGHPVTGKFDEKGKQVWCHEPIAKSEGVILPSSPEVKAQIDKIYGETMATGKGAPPSDVSRGETSGATSVGIDIDALLQEMIDKGLKTAGEQRAWVAKMFPGTVVSGPLAIIIGKLSPEQQQALCNKINEATELKG